MLLCELSPNFKGGSTSTENKLAVDKEIYRHIKVPKGQNIVMLVGKADGLKRHLDAAQKDMGLDDLSHLWIVDINGGLIKDLENAFEDMKDQYTGVPHFVTADLLKFLKSWDSKNGKIYFVDFDGTQSASKYHIDLYQACMNLDVAYVAMVGSTRVESKELAALNAELGYEDVKRRKNVKAADQRKIYGDVKNGRTLVGEHPRSSAEILSTYLTRDSGQESVLKFRNYQGARNAPMFVYLFKVH